MIVKLTGGLANQFFMYAFGRGTAKKRGEQLAFCWEPSTWAFALDRYVDVPIVGSRPARHVYEEHGMQFDPAVQDRTRRDPYFCGYWQTERYFEHIKDELRSEIHFKHGFNELVLETRDKLLAENSVFVHVRRGDYTKPTTMPYHGLLQMDYYNAAMELMRAKVPAAVFYVFSDDQEWCRNNFPDTTVMPFPTSYADIDFYLMRNCKHAILANSTFGWWAAWLGADADGGTVIAPKKWFGPANQHLDTRDLIPTRWMTI